MSTETLPENGKNTKGGSPGLMLALATIGFAVNFWAWALLSPLGSQFAETLNLSAFQVSAFVAVPVIVGSLGRIPIGALTDKFGGRVMFPVVSVLTIIPVLFLGFIGQNSYVALLIGGFFLGIGGTVFAVGVPYVNNWYPPEKRGTAIGIFGVGMGGTAISALTTVHLVKAGGSSFPFIICAIALAIYAVVAWLLLRDAPNRTVPEGSLASRLGKTVKLSTTWQACALYATLFGGYVAFSVYLPTYLQVDYSLTASDASNRMAGFVILAVIMRPVGGFLSDKMGPIFVLTACLVFTILGALGQATGPELMPLGTICFLVMAAALGAGSGATFALVAKVAPQNMVGSVTGVVGAAGGLGGFVPPLLMGAIYSATGSYSIGFILLAVVAGLVLLFLVTKIRAVYVATTGEVKAA